MAKAKEKPVISQFTLQRIYTMEKTVEKLKNQIKEIEGRINPAAEEVISLLESGATIEFGKRLAAIEIQKGRRSPSWKDEVIRLEGKEYAERIINSTEPTPDKKKLKVI